MVTKRQYDLDSALAGIAITFHSPEDAARRSLRWALWAIAEECGLKNLHAAESPQPTFT